MSTLAEFAKAEGKVSGCKVCAHPRVTEIDEGHAKGLSIACIARWLVHDPEAAPIVGETSLRRHFGEPH
jgi:hypothetical protein